MISGVEPLSLEMADAINNLDTTWKAGHNTSPGSSVEEVKQWLGVHPAYFESPELRLPERQLDDEILNIMKGLPEEFDSRKRWPDCDVTISQVRDQGSCGSCWAFGAVEAMSDRICIATQGETVIDLSAEDLVSCCGFFHLPPCGFGCSGGFPDMAWLHWRLNGIVSGGLYNGTGCRPYSIPPCAHHVNGTSLPECGGKNGETGETPECKKQCQEGYGKGYTDDRYYGNAVYSLKGEEAIKADIYLNGPVEAAYTVYSDFPSYKSGVYQAHTNETLGGHAVKVIGWGVENGVKYWLAVNSWNKYWGDNGYFKILRGVNECGIEEGVSAGLPKLY